MRVNSHKVINCSDEYSEEEQKTAEGTAEVSQEEEEIANNTPDSECPFISSK